MSLLQQLFGCFRRAVAFEVEKQQGIVVGAMVLELSDVDEELALITEQCDVWFVTQIS